MIQFSIFLFCLFLTYALYLFATRKSEAQRRRLQQRLAETLIYVSDADDVQLRLSREETLSEIPWLNRSLLRLPVAVRLKRMLDQADLHITVARLVMFSLMAGIMAMLAVSAIVSSWMVIIFAGVLAAVVPFAHVVRTRQKRLHRFLEYLPEALELMGRALSAGHAFSETLHLVATEMPEPIATEFRKTYEEQNLGLSLKLALENLARRVPLLDLRLCITAVLIQRETGGNLGEVLEKVAHTIRDRFRIVEELRTLTTQSRWGAYILGALPVFLAVAVSSVNPEYMNVFWTDPRGHKLIALGIAMQITGILVIRRIMNIKV